MKDLLKYYSSQYHTLSSRLKSLLLSLNLTVSDLQPSVPNPLPSSIDDKIFYSDPMSVDLPLTYPNLDPSSLQVEIHDIQSLPSPSFNKEYVKRVRAKRGVQDVLEIRFKESTRRKKIKPKRRREGKAIDAVREEIEEMFNSISSITHRSTYQ